MAASARHLPKRSAPAATSGSTADAARLISLACGAGQLSAARSLTAAAAWSTVDSAENLAQVQEVIILILMMGDLVQIQVAIVLEGLVLVPIALIVLIVLTIVVMIVVVVMIACSSGQEECSVSASAPFIQQAERSSKPT